jgi:adenosine deaminase
MEDENVVALACERGTVFEVCVTSNYQSGVVPALSEHPLPRMLKAGLNVTLNTDDPSVSRIDLSHEFKLAREDLGIQIDVLMQRVLAAARASFLPERERKELVRGLEKELGL